MGRINQLPDTIVQQLSASISGLPKKNQDKLLTNMETKVLEQFESVDWAGDKNSIKTLEFNIKSLQGFVGKAPLKAAEVDELRSQILLMKKACDALKESKSPGVKQSLITQIQKDLEGVDEAINLSGSARVFHRQMMEEEMKKYQKPLAAHREMVKNTREAAVKAEKAKPYDDKAAELSKTKRNEQRPLNVPQGFERKFGFATVAQRSQQHSLPTYAQAAKQPISYAQAAHQGVKTAKDNEAAIARAAAAKAKAKTKPQDVAHPTKTPKAKPAENAQGWQNVKSRRKNEQKQVESSPVDEPIRHEKKDDEGWQTVEKRRS